MKNTDLCLWVFVCIINSPNSSTCPNVKYTLGLGIRFIRWSESEFVIKSQKEEIVLKI